MARSLSPHTDSSSGAQAVAAQAFRFAQLPSGARIAWTRSGAPGAPTLVRVAHWLTNVEYDLRSPIWRPWVERLSRSFGLVRYDERGCGLSGDDPRPRGLEPWVEELEAVIEAAVDATREPRVALLGVSGAAAIAIAYAMRHPERVSRLVILGGFLHGAMHRCRTPEDRGFLEAQWRLVEFGWGRNDPEVREFFSSRFVPDATPEVRTGMNEQQRRSCDGPRAAEIMRARAELDVRALAPQVTVPTLVLHCDGDRAVPVELGHDIAASIPGARFESLPSANHVPLGHEPAFARFCDAVVDFVTGAGGTPRLTPRERELAGLVAQGLDNAQIAVRLGVADKTVRNALSALYAKLGVDNRARAVARSRDLGL
jgi:pimeloyl-ACP methyl ester carboxylesterase/DNA-binding CsgD family transcriptional regulator